jgi:hypothetical protein
MTISAFRTAVFLLALGNTTAISTEMVKPIVILRVTTLDTAGPGSLREALEDPRPRLVVFEVGGVIDLQGHALRVSSPHLVVAGQTAPDPGITLIRGSLTVETFDVIIQHIAVRLGDGADAGDSLGASRAHDVVFDHCSATWAVDENLSVSGPRDESGPTSHDVTLRSCIIAEGLMHANHPKGPHSMGSLIHDGVKNVTITGCLYAHNNERNPRLKGGTTARVTGNVMYDWGSACLGAGAKGNQKMLEPAEAVVEDNVAIAGPSTTDAELIKTLDIGGRLTLRNNVFVARGAPVPASARQTLDRVLRTAGSRPWKRDPIDSRIVQSVIDRSGRIIDSQRDVGGYPVRPATRRKLVIPKDHLDEWLKEFTTEGTKGTE